MGGEGQRGAGKRSADFESLNTTLYKGCTTGLFLAQKGKKCIDNITPVEVVDRGCESGIYEGVRRPERREL